MVNHFFDFLDDRGRHSDFHNDKEDERSSDSNE